MALAVPEALVLGMRGSARGGERAASASDLEDALDVCGALYPSSEEGRILSLKAALGLAGTAVQIAVLGSFIGGRGGRPSTNAAIRREPVRPLHCVKLENTQKMGLDVIPGTEDRRFRATFALLSTLSLEWKVRS